MSTSATVSSRNVLNGFLVADSPYQINVLVLNHESTITPKFHLYIGSIDGRVLHYEGSMQGEKNMSSDEIPPSPPLTPPLIRITKKSPFLPTKTDSKPKPSTNFKEFEKRMAKLISQRLISKQPVESICVLSTVKRIATMSSGQVLLLDYISLDKIVKLSMPKGAYLLARQLHSKPNTQHGRTIVSNKLAVATKTRLILYEVKENSNPSHDESPHPQQMNSSRALSATLLKDILLLESPSVIAWVSDTIISGSVNQYSIISVKDASSNPLFTIQKDASSLIQPPYVHCLPESMQFCLLVEDIGLVLTSSGEPTGNTLPLKSNALAIAECFPYILTLSNGIVDVFNRKMGTKLQSLFFSTTDDVASKYFLADDVDSSIIAVADKSHVWCLQKVSRDEQIKELLRKREYEQAITFASESSPSESMEAVNCRVGQVHAQAAFLLLSELRFEDAMDHFTESSVFNPSELFPLFPRFSSKWTSQIPRKRYWGLHPPLQSLEELVRCAFRDVKNTIVPTPPVPTPRRLTPRDFLQSSSSFTASSFSSFPSFSSPSHPFPPASSFSLTPKPSSQSYGVSAQELIKLQLAEIEPYVMDAMYYISRYFMNIRKKTLSKFEHRAIDTLLVYLFIQLEEMNELENFVSEQNYCIIEDVEDLLKDNHLYKSLALLFQSNGLKERAIEIWFSLAKGDFVGADSPDAILEQALSVSPGTPRGIRSLAAQNLSSLLSTVLDPHLVLLHLPWLLEFNSELCLTLLTSLDSKNPLQPITVLPILSTNIRRRYLKWIIEEGRPYEDDANTNLHTIYALSMADECLTYQPTLSQTDTSSSTSSSTSSFENSFSIGSHFTDDKIGMLELEKDETDQMNFDKFDFLIERFDENEDEDDDVSQSRSSSVSKSDFVPFPSSSFSSSSLSFTSSSVSVPSTFSSFSKSTSSSSITTITNSTSSSSSLSLSLSSLPTSSTSSSMQTMAVISSSSSSSSPSSSLSSYILSSSISNSFSSPPHSTPIIINEKRKKKLMKLRYEFQSFLLLNNRFDVEIVLKRLKHTFLLREQVISFCKIGNHIQALQILALKLEDSDGAEKYCELLYHSSIYDKLLDMYLNSENDKKMMMSSAIKLIHCHNAFLDPLKIIQKFDMNAPLLMSMKFLSCLIRERIHRRRKGEITRHLSRGENLNTRFLKSKETKACVLIDENTVCKKCKSKIGVRLFASFPDGSLSCYKCMRSIE